MGKAQNILTAPPTTVFCLVLLQYTYRLFYCLKVQVWFCIDSSSWRVAFTCKVAYNIKLTCLQMFASSYVVQLSSLISSIPRCCHLSSATCGDLHISLTSTIRYSPRSFGVAGSTVWNSLPLDEWTYGTIHWAVNSSEVNSESQNAASSWQPRLQEPWN